MGLRSRHFIAKWFTTSIMLATFIAVVILIYTTRDHPFHPLHIQPTGEPTLTLSNRIEGVEGAALTTHDVIHLDPIRYTLCNDSKQTIPIKIGYTVYGINKDGKIVQVDALPQLVTAQLPPGCPPQRPTASTIPLPVGIGEGHWRLSVSVTATNGRDVQQLVVNTEPFTIIDPPTVIPVPMPDPTPTAEPTATQ